MTVYTCSSCEQQTACGSTKMVRFSTLSFQIDKAQFTFILPTRISTRIWLTISNGSLQPGTWVRQVEFEYKYVVKSDLEVSNFEFVFSKNFPNVCLIYWALPILSVFHCL